VLSGIRRTGAASRDASLAGVSLEDISLEEDVSLEIVSLEIVSLEIVLGSPPGGRVAAAVFAGTIAAKASSACVGSGVARALA
jgi:hypothetical protein